MARIGNWLRGLSVRSEDEILTAKMEPGTYFNHATQARCLVGCAMGLTGGANGASRTVTESVPLGRSWQPRRGMATSFEGYYDAVCGRFGTARVNTAIRNRILSNRLKRMGSIPSHGSLSCVEDRVEQVVAV